MKLKCMDCWLCGVGMMMYGKSSCRQKDTIRTEPQAKANLESIISQKEGIEKEPIPPGVRRRPSLARFKKRPCKLFEYIGTPNHHVAAWILNQVYLAMPNPDPNWASDCQTGNFHTRLWEAYLLACFREQGLLVKQDFHAPDFHISNCHGDQAWVEAVTANPKIPYEHVGSTPTPLPKDIDDLLDGPAVLRFHNTLRNKLDKGYNQFEHVVGYPFVLAIADFQSPGSMIWSREALICYLYGTKPKVIKIAGRLVAVPAPTDGHGNPPCFFHHNRHKQISSIIFSNGCTIAKLSRVGVSAGADPGDYKFVRYGTIWDKTPGALKPIEFCLDITSDGYRNLWPYGSEPWSAEIEVFHNPYAQYPLRDSFLPEATHWRLINGEVEGKSFYETSILSSKTLILNKDQKTPTLDDFVQK